jgi:hypothetical protein
MFLPVVEVLETTVGNVFSSISNFKMKKNGVMPDLSDAPIRL